MCLSQVHLVKVPLINLPGSLNLFASDFQSLIWVPGSFWSVDVSLILKSFIHAGASNFFSDISSFPLLMLLRSKLQYLLSSCIFGAACKVLCNYVFDLDWWILEIDSFETYFHLHIHLVRSNPESLNKLLFNLY